MNIQYVFVCILAVYIVAIIICIDNISSTMQHGLSPLYEASELGHAEKVEMLLKGGANPNQAGRVHWK